MRNVTHALIVLVVLLVSQAHAAPSASSYHEQAQLHIASVYHEHLLDSQDTYHGDADYHSDADYHGGFAYHLCYHDAFARA